MMAENLYMLSIDCCYDSLTNTPFYRKNFHIIIFCYVILKRPVVSICRKSFSSFMELSLAN